MIARIKRRINHLFDLPKTLYFNLKCFPVRVALKRPVLVTKHTIIKGCYRGCIELPQQYSTGILRLGIDEGSDGVSLEKKNFFIRIDDNAKIKLTGENVTFARGGSIRISSGGKLVIGSNVAVNVGGAFFINTDCHIGNDCMMGWNTTLFDTNGHVVYNTLTNEELPETKPIVIGNHVWIGAESVILKGSHIGDNSIVAYKSCVTSKFDEENLVIGGKHAHIIKENTSWKM